MLAFGDALLWTSVCDFYSSIDGSFIFFFYFG